MRIGRNARLYTSIVLVAALIATAIGTRAAQQAKDQRMVKAMMQKTRTVCVGRLLIDLPVDAQVSFSNARLGSVDIDVERGYTSQRLAAVISNREASLAGKMNEYGRPSLEKRLVTDAVNFQATLLYFGREKAVAQTSDGQSVSGEEGITVEAFGVKDEFFYRFKGQSLSSPKYEQYVLALVKQFESRADTSVPTGAGFCTEHGIIHDPISADEFETVTMFASLRGHPDIAIRLDTAVLDKPQESLLTRDANNDINTRFSSNIKSLGKGSRELNGIPGEEILNRFKEKNGTTGHMFMWDSLGKPSDVLAPSITLEIETGRGLPGSPVNSSLSDEAVLQLWQAISSSLRIRPTSADKKATSENAAPSVPLGAVVGTGQTCPQTGYWQCTENGSAAAQRHFVRQGDVMPQAILPGAPSLWQKIRGGASVRRVSTQWQLVAYDTAPDDAWPDTV